MPDSPCVTVVTICREPVPVVLRFLAWHRARGATLIRLYLDDPDDPVISLVTGLDWIGVTRCDADFWAVRGLTPSSPFMLRQVAALTDGYRKTTEGWVAVLDADELFYFGGRSFQQVLETVKEDVRGVRVATAEHVNAGDPAAPGLHFRLPMTPEEVEDIYGANKALFEPFEGLIGHPVGKSITRAGLRIRRVRAHWVVAGKSRDATDLRLGPAEGAYLLHLINPGYDIWRRKLDHRMATPGGVVSRVKRRVREIRAGGGDIEAGLEGLFRQLYQMDAAALARLAAAGRHLLLSEDLDGDVARFFPGITAPS